MTGFSMRTRKQQRPLERASMGTDRTSMPCYSNREAVLVAAAVVAAVAEGERISYSLGLVVETETAERIVAAAVGGTS